MVIGTGQSIASKNKLCYVMGKCQMLLMVALLFVVPTLSVEYCVQQWTEEDPISSPPYNFKLALQWPPSLCNGREEPCKSLPSPQNTNFTIHGLWHPQDCNIQNYYNLILTNQLLLQRLLVSWPDVICGDHRRFWAQEWKRHGVCHSNFFPDMEEYLNSSVNLTDQFDIYKLIRETSALAPGGAYNLVDIIDAIKKGTSGQPELMCNCAGGKDLKWNCNLGRNLGWECINQTAQQLVEVRICFDKQDAWVVVDCPVRGFSDEKVVSFPPPLPPSPTPPGSPSSVQLTTCSVFYTIVLFFGFLCVF